MQQVVEQRAASNRAAGVGGGRGGGGGGGRQPQRPLLLPVIVRDDLTAAYGNRYVPLIHGCRVIKDTSFHYRWQGEYPRPAPLTRYCGQGFNVSSDRDALIFCLHQLWRWHFEATGQDCPYDFQADIA